MTENTTENGLLQARLLDETARIRNEMQERGFMKSENLMSVLNVSETVAKILQQNGEILEMNRKLLEILGRAPLLNIKRPPLTGALPEGHEYA